MGWPATVKAAKTITANPAKKLGWLLEKHKKTLKSV
jgi:hypothetical protein